MIDTSVFEGKRVVFHTLGCKLNFAESSALGKMLLEAGYERCKVGERAGIVVVNTCSVTDTADKKCRQAISRLLHKHPGCYMVVTGCYAQLKPDEILNIEGVDLVLGSNEKFSLPEFLSKLDKGSDAHKHVTRLQEIESFVPSCSADDRTRHFLKVQDGCDYYCTYCTIPFARGKSRNATIAETVRVAEEAVANGAKEIVLTGVNTGDFGKSTGETFFDLIKALDRVEGVARYRISSIEPNLLSDEIIEFVSQSERFAPHFHIPLQSGSNAVLKLMHRRYTTELFAQKVQKIKELMPHAFIGVDVMVGVRGETPEYFQETYDFLKGLDISQLHVFTYSERAGTKALQIEYVVPHKERKQRSELLHELSEEKHARFCESQKGRSAQVLWEDTKRSDMMNGFTENYVKVERPFDKSLVNTIQEVMI